MTSSYTMTTNDIGWRGYVVRYILYFWCETEWVENDNK